MNTIVFRTMEFEPKLISKLILNQSVNKNDEVELVLKKSSPFADRDLSVYANEKEAYHQLIADIVHLQSQSTKLIIAGSDIKKIFVDGGFSKNSIYMNLLAAAFPEIEVYAASMAQTTA